MDDLIRQKIAELTIDEKGLEKNEAIKKLNKLIGIPLINIATEIIAFISSTQRDKMISNAATRKSAKNGFTYRIHNAAASRIDKLWKYAVLFESRTDRNNDINIRSIKRFIAPLKYGTKTAIAYITAKESKLNGHRIYSLELENIKAVEGMLEMLQEQSPASTPLTTDSLRQLVESVNPNCNFPVLNNRPQIVIIEENQKT